MRTESHTEGKNKLRFLHSTDSNCVGISAKRALAAVVLMLTTLLSCTSAFAISVQEQIQIHLENIRSVSAEGDSKAIDDYNRKMDAAWSFFMTNKTASLPALNEAVFVELKKPNPNNMLLLDVGYFLAKAGDGADKEVGKMALLALDPTAKVVRLNARQLFDFTHLVAASHDERVLNFIDRAFLRQPTSLFIPQHALKLDETLVCAFLYGVYGDGAEVHVAGALVDKAVAARAIEVLTWIGGPASVGRVEEAYRAEPTKDMFVRMTTFMMRAAGPQGRAAMLSVDAGKLDPDSKVYFDKVRPAIEATDFAGMSAAFDSLPVRPKLDDAEVQRRLADMYKNYGKDEKTSPVSILRSTIARDDLIKQLVAIRARTWNRISDEALYDIEGTNALLAALRYRDR